MRNPVERAKRIGKNIVHAFLERNPRLEDMFDRAIICRRFRQVHGHYPNLKNPVSFSEKIAYKILHDRRALLTAVADKIRARDYVRERIGPNYLTKIYQIAEKPEDIEWDQLPPQFAIKVNHGSGWNILVPDKGELNVAAAIAQLNFWLSKNYYRYSREWAYRNIARRVYVEELLKGEDGKTPIDWKFHVFGGKAHYMHVDLDRFNDHRQNFYDRDLKRLDLRYLRESRPEDPPFPANMEEMFGLAERLGQEFDYIRVDFYNIAGRIVFGELTNYPNAGYVRFDPEEIDRQFGAHWTQPRNYGQMKKAA